MGQSAMCCASRDEDSLEHAPNMPKLAPTEKGKSPLKGRFGPGARGMSILAPGNANLNSYDVVIGLPSYNEEDSIANVTRQADLGALRFLPNMKVLIVNADCESDDKTKEVFLTTKTTCDKEYYTTSEPGSGKGSALRYVFERMQQVNARFGMCFDADLNNFSAEWVQTYAMALEQGFDMVTPRYTRHRFDGTIGNLICFPIIYAVFGTSVHQPIGGDFAFSRQAVDAYLEPDPWPPGCLEYGIDIFMTTTCLIKKLKLAEVVLPFKSHKPSLCDPAGMVLNILNTLMYQIKASEDHIRDSLAKLECEKVPLLDAQNFRNIVVPEMTADPEVLKDLAKEEYKRQQSIVDANCPKSIIPNIRSLVDQGIMTQDSWAKLLCWGVEKCLEDFSNREKVVPVLQVGFLLRAPAHLRTVKDLGNKAAEEVVEQQARLCFDRRPKLKP